MKVLVAVKRVVDHAVKVRVNPSTNRINTKGVKMAINPFCEIAMEEAIRLKEKKIADEVIAVSVGSKSSQEQLRYCISLGADRGILVETQTPIDVDIPPLTIAKVLQQVALQEKPDLILMGKQSIDGDNGQTGAMLAGLLDWPQASCIFSLDCSNDGKKAVVKEEIETGSRVLDVPLPAVMTTDLRLNTPRYPKLPDIVKAKKKPLQIIAMDSLVKDPSMIQIEKLEDPPSRKKGIICKDVDELIHNLQKNGVL